MTSMPATSPASVRQVRSQMSRKAYPPGATIFAVGEAGTFAYVLLRGDVTILITPGAAVQRVASELMPGQMFGVHALTPGTQSTASAVTEHGCEVLAVSEAKLRQKLDEADPLIRYWINYLSKRVLDLSWQ